MKTNALLRIMSLGLIMLFSTAVFWPLKSNPGLSKIQNLKDGGKYFNPRQYFNKQCAFCHNENSKIAPSMGEIKAAYNIAYPKKEDFVKHMTAFVLQPSAEHRLIKTNLKKYKVMPSGMFYDAKKIQKVVAYIYDSVEVPDKFKPQKNDTIRLKDIDKKSKAIEAKIKLQKGVDICKVLNLKPVDFEFAKTSIHPAMAKQLDNLVQFLKANPKINIEIRNYTDARGSEQRNLLLSTKRATAIKRYLIKHGISYRRIKAKGYGESKLINHCKDGVPCSEEEHAKNRRTELIIW